MKEVLTRVEGQVPSSRGPAQTMMVAIYALWHALTAPVLHRPDANQFLKRYEVALERPSVPAFVLAVLGGQHPLWSAEEWSALAKERREERRQRSHLRLPPGVDMALQLMAAEALLEDGKAEAAATVAAAAAEEGPGNEQVMRWEAALLRGDGLEIDLRALLCGVSAAEEAATPNKATSTDVLPTDEADEAADRVDEPADDAAGMGETNGVEPTSQDGSLRVEPNDPCA